MQKLMELVSMCNLSRILKSGSRKLFYVSMYRCSFVYTTLVAGYLNVLSMDTLKTFVLLIMYFNFFISSKLHLSCRLSCIAHPLGRPPQNHALKRLFIGMVLRSEVWMFGFSGGSQCRCLRLVGGQDCNLDRTLSTLESLHAQEAGFVESECRLRIAES
jgi:hypothetical protein